MISPKTHAAALAHLTKADPVMGRVMAQFGPCQLGRKRRDPFHVLAGSIISQQLSTKAADTIQKRVMAGVGAEKHLTPQQLAGADIPQLRACGLSNAKAKWLIALGQASLNGTLDLAHIHKMSDAQAMEMLDALPGIGPWTAEMLLMFAFDRLDVFSLGDLGLRRGAELLYNKKKPLSDAKLLKISKVWAPYRSIASWYLWRAIEGENAAW